MIKFFRHIRKDLMETGKTGKYLKYAIGEIILVVIGILIALQINNWNEIRKIKLEEQNTLKNLNAEFKKNQLEISDYIKKHHQFLEATTKLVTLVGESDEVLNANNLDSLIAQSINYDNYSPSQSVVSDVVSSGKLNNITSDVLRFKLFEWSSSLEKNEEAYSTMDEISQTLFLPYLSKHASMKNIDKYGILNWKEKSKFNHNNAVLFKDLEFENMIDNQAWNIKNYINHLENLESVMNYIIQETENELKPY